MLVAKALDSIFKVNFGTELNDPLFAVRYLVDVPCLDVAIVMGAPVREPSPYTHAR
jgi:hypothetical protein